MTISCTCFNCRFGHTLAQHPLHRNLGHRSTPATLIDLLNFVFKIVLQCWFQQMGIGRQYFVWLNYVCVWWRITKIFAFRFLYCDASCSRYSCLTWVWPQLRRCHLRAPFPSSWRRAPCARSRRQRHAAPRCDRRCRRRAGWSRSDPWGCLPAAAGTASDAAAALCAGAATHRCRV